MTKTEIAGKEFEVGRVDLFQMAFGMSEVREFPYLSHTLDGVHKSKKMIWDCKDQSRVPDPFPKHFVAEPHLLVYQSPGGLRPSTEDVDRAGYAAGQAFMKALGFGVPKFLNEAIIKSYGTSKIPIDVDKLIEKRKPTERLLIRVKLRYVHFELHNPKIVPGAKIILSLPESLSIDIQSTHICRKGKQYPKDQNIFWEYDAFSTIVRAETAEAWKLRKGAHEADISNLEEQVDVLEKMIEEKKKEMDAGKPKRD